MEIHLSEDLRRFVADQLRTGRFLSADEVVREALLHCKHSQQPAASGPTPDPSLGSMHEDAEMLDDIVEDDMRIREERPWRLPGGQ
jgi:Arc/MetJ-type ribon-helix-helix transcriptional regulator